MDYNNIMTQDKTRYSVWVGGMEVNDYPLTKDQAESLTEMYKLDEYSDVKIEKLTEYE